mgnify:FL=1
MKFHRMVSFRPAFDRRHKDPTKNYGIGGVAIFFQLRGTNGGVTWEILTPMLLPRVHKETCAKNTPETLEILYRGMGGPLSYHSLKPQFKGQTRRETPCEMTGKPYCYCDGSFIAGGDLYDVFLEKGEEAVWEEMEKYYKASV